MNASKVPIDLWVLTCIQLPGLASLLLGTSLQGLSLLPSLLDSHHQRCLVIPN